jgi:membrane protein implicated in regulation of membrane protease activity
MGFDGSALEFVYLTCFFLGLGFAVISGLLGGLFSGGAEAHVDLGGTPSEFGTGGDGPVHFPLLSPVTLALFISTFGGVGYLLNRLSPWPVEVQVPVAGGSGLVVGLGVSWFFWRLMRSMESTSHIRGDEAVGSEAEVTVPIPVGGLGEIAFTARGSRQNSPARAADGQDLPARSIVKIVKLVGSTYLVERPRT